MVLDLIWPRHGLDLLMRSDGVYDLVALYLDPDRGTGLDSLLMTSGLGSGVHFEPMVW